MRLEEGRWSSAAALGEQGLTLVPLPSGEALPPTVRVTLWADHADVDNRAWLLTQPEARDWRGSRELRSLLVDERGLALADEKDGLQWDVLADAVRRARAPMEARPEPPSTVVVAPHADAAASDVMRALYASGQAGLSSYQLAGFVDDTPMGALASRPGPWTEGHCVGRSLLMIGESASLVVQDHADQTFRACESLAEPGALAAAVDRLRAGCGPTWDRVTPDLSARDLPPEAWQCFQVITVGPRDGPANASGLLTELGALHDLYPQAISGLIAIEAESRGWKGCSDIPPLSALDEAGWKLVCDGTDLSAERFASQERIDLSARETPDEEVRDLPVRR